VIIFTSFGPGGPGISLATTHDFQTVSRMGMVRAPEDKNGALLPRRVNGEFILFHRPVTAIMSRADIWLSRSTDLHSWSSPEPVLAARPGGWWDSARIGIGPPPLETSEGWLVIYHGVRQTVAGALYRVGLALLDLDNPSKVLRRCSEWVLGPTESYELMGDVPGVVFPCGLIHDADTGDLRLYYGAADTCIGLATATLDDVLTYVRECGST
jgi:beta-1,2-mannobiose phosphorylase / 1,2-beta-oligomannan phosphorylase